jgi:hypothetical protein
MGTVEPVFGSLQNKGTRRFTLRAGRRSTRSGNSSPSSTTSRRSPGEGGRTEKYGWRWGSTASFDLERYAEMKMAALVERGFAAISRRGFSTASRTGDVMSSILGSSAVAEGPGELRERGLLARYA